ncbi:MAG: ATP-binding cassette domain-containing protein [Thermoanaerobaculia bacterium]
MLPVSLHEVEFRHRSGFTLSGVTLEFEPSTHTAIVGTGGSGISTLLGLITGELTPQRGEVRIGDRTVNGVRQSKRPLLHVTDQLDVPGRWAVDHALVAALRDRSLDRTDRQREFELAAVKWQLTDLLRRRVDSLSSSERGQLSLACIELIRPAILVADRLLAPLSPALRSRLADELFRTLRVIGTTVISAPSDHAELAYSDRVVLLDRGEVIQVGTAAEVWTRPIDDRAAEATGVVNAIPVTIRGTTVESPIGIWEVSEPPFQGTGLALLRPGDFAVARPGEESDFVFSIEEAGFSSGRWIARGYLSGGVTLRVELPPELAIRKGRPLPLRFEPSRVTFIARALEMPQLSVPTDVIPLMRDSR